MEGDDEKGDSNKTKEGCIASVPFLVPIDQEEVSIFTESKGTKANASFEDILQELEELRYGISETASEEMALGTMIQNDW